jgi:hypothetical protein
MFLGIGLGLLLIGLLFGFLAFIILKETSTHRFWRAKVEEGDLEMIGQLVAAAVDDWRTQRPPKGVPASVWQGIQGVEVLEVGRDYIRCSCSAEGQFALVGGERRQVSSALDEGRRITARLAELFFYDVPHVSPDRVQIDVYATFRELGGEATQRCILTTVARRADAADIDWENDPADMIAGRLGARFQLDAHGAPQPIEPEAPAPRPSTNGARAEGPPSA